MSSEGGIDGNDDSNEAMAVSWAEACVLQHHYKEAFCLFVQAAHAGFSDPERLKEGLSLCLREWGEELQMHGNLRQLLVCYHEACKLFPDSPAMLSNMGGQLFRWVGLIYE